MNFFSLMPFKQILLLALCFTCSNCSLTAKQEQDTPQAIIKISHAPNSSSFFKRHWKKLFLTVGGAGAVILAIWLFMPEEAPKSILPESVGSTTQEWLRNLPLKPDPMTPPPSYPGINATSALPTSPVIDKRPRPTPDSLSSDAESLAKLPGLEDPDPAPPVSPPGPPSPTLTARSEADFRPLRSDSPTAPPSPAPARPIPSGAPDPATTMLTELSSPAAWQALAPQEAPTFTHAALTASKAVLMLEPEAQLRRLEELRVAALENTIVRRTKERYDKYEPDFHRQVCSDESCYCRKSEVEKAAVKKAEIERAMEAAKQRYGALQARVTEHQVATAATALARDAHVAVDADSKSFAEFTQAMIHRIPLTDSKNAIRPLLAKLAAEVQAKRMTVTYALTQAWLAEARLQICSPYTKDRKITGVIKAKATLVAQYIAMLQPTAAKLSPIKKACIAKILRDFVYDEQWEVLPTPGTVPPTYWAAALAIQQIMEE